MTPLSDPWPIKPFTQPLRDAVVSLPGSKSLTNRALLIAALCNRPITLTDALFSDDTEIMAEALRQLGFVVREDKAQKTITIDGPHRRGGLTSSEEAKLDVGLAGTAARFLTALCAAKESGTYYLDGVPQMHRRPMKGLIDTLRSQGAIITCTGEEGFFPLTIEAHGLNGGAVNIDATESSQMLSALLMVAPLAKHNLVITLNGGVRWPFVQMTARLMEEFGQEGKIRRFGANTILVAAGQPYRFTGSVHSIYAIEPDATTASYFLALPLVTTGSLHLPLLNVGSDGLQGDTRFAAVLEKIGLGLADLDRISGIKASFIVGSVRRGVTDNFNEFSDTFLTLAAIAPLLDGPTTITGIAHTRKQETDRVAGMAHELKKLGQDVIETDDSLAITPNLAELKMRAAQGVIEIETYGDHRFAMSFAILGCYDLLGNGRPWLSIKNPACCAKTFPNFFDVLAEVWKNSHPDQSPSTS